MADLLEGLMAAAARRHSLSRTGSTVADRGELRGITERLLDQPDFRVVEQRNEFVEAAWPRFSPGLKFGL